MQLLARLASLRQLRVQAGVLDLQPPLGPLGAPSYRGAAGANTRPAPWMLCLIVSLQEVLSVSTDAGPPFPAASARQEASGSRLQLQPSSWRGRCPTPHSVHLQACRSRAPVAGIMSAFVTQLTDLHIRCEKATAKTAAALQVDQQSQLHVFSRLSAM